MMLNKENTILFQGDSITDGDRLKDQEGLGSGYVSMAAKVLQGLYPELNLKMINRGVGGDRICNLEERWQTDCLDLKPDIVTILIGINNTWWKYCGAEATSVKEFGVSYRKLLTQIKENTDAKIIILEPYVLPLAPGQENWCEDLAPKIEVTRSLAKEFACHYVPLNGMFAQAAVEQSVESLVEDGVHPTKEGQRIIAKGVLKALGVTLI